MRLRFIVPCVYRHNYGWVHFPRSVLFCQPHQQLFTHTLNLKYVRKRQHAETEQEEKNTEKPLIIKREEKLQTLNALKFCFSVWQTYHLRKNQKCEIRIFVIHKRLASVDVIHHYCWGGDSSVVRAPDSWLKGRGFESLLERRETFFFSRVNFLCWLLFRYPFHPRVTAVARKRPRSFCQKCRWQVTAKHAYMYVALHEVTRCMGVWYTRNAPRRQQIHVAPAMPALYMSTPLRWILKKRARQTIKEEGRKQRRR